ncbi:hypothetical protein CPB86DRAFT_780758 [Serendipita vermifera]|nr:hypothetical protein CPB86DRAFT_780758 [Serendipita vermifera]
MLDWDDTRIVFTKRELLNFLKYMGTSVDPNYNNISKLPRYANFYKVTAGANTGAADTSIGSSAGGNDSSASNFVPTRRVREAPGGKSSINFYDDSQEDALAAAPAKTVEQQPAPKITEEPQGLPQPTGVPTRRVRDPPGGKDSLKSLWDAPEEEEFKPTRRVRDNPGGEDHIGFY